MSNPKKWYKSWWGGITSVHCESKKQDTILLFVTSPNDNQFSIFFTVRLSGKFARNSSLNIPPHLNYVATLPCGIPTFKDAMLKK